MKPFVMRGVVRKCKICLSDNFSQLEEKKNNKNVLNEGWENGKTGWRTLSLLSLFSSETLSVCLFLKHVLCCQNKKKKATKFNTRKGLRPTFVLLDCESMKVLCLRQTLVDKVLHHNHHMHRSRHSFVQ